MEVEEGVGVNNILSDSVSFKSSVKTRTLRKVLSQVRRDRSE